MTALQHWHPIFCKHMTGGPRDRGQVFEGFMWQKVKSDANINTFSSEGCAAVDDIEDHDEPSSSNCVQFEPESDALITPKESSDHHLSASMPPASAAAFIRSIFNRAPPPPATLREAW